MPFDELAEINVLLVDDDEAMLRTTADILRLRGIRPEVARSAKEALRVAEANPPTVALVDLLLPDMDGLELAAHLRKDPICSEVIILTGNATVDSAVRALRQQSVDYLIKPVENDDLFRSVERAAFRFFRGQVGTRLRESEEQLQRVFSAVNEGLIITDSKGEIVRANAAAAGIAGMVEDDLHGINLKAVLVPVDEDGHEEGGRGESSEATIMRPDGSQRRVEVAVATFAPGRLVHTVRDVTAQREVQEQLRQAQKMESVGRLAGGVAHDFNNLLTAINGNCEIALLDMPPEDPTRPCLEEIQKSGQRAANLTRQLLAFSRKQVLQPVLLDMSEVVRKMETLLAPMIGEDIDLRCSYGMNVGLVRADPTQVEQVVLNLAGNARDAMPLGGVLTIEVDDLVLDEPCHTEHGCIPAGSYVRLSVSDTGIGIPSDIRPSVFEPFFTTKATGKGTGLGLATVYGVVRQSGGEITLESESGEGTTIRMYLPRVEGTPAGEESRQEFGESEPSRGETILIAEDEDAVRLLMVRTLTRLGYHVLAAADGAEALSLFRTRDGAFDLVVCDVVMPELGGTELVERLKAIGGDVPVLYISGYTDDVRIQHEVLDGVALLEKPFTLPAFAARVREVLDRAGAVRSPADRESGELP